MMDESKKSRKELNQEYMKRRQTGGRFSNQKYSQRKSIARKQFESRRPVKRPSLYAQDRKPSQ